MEIHGLVRRLVRGGKQHGNTPLGLDFLGAVGVSPVQNAHAIRAAAGARFATVMGNGSTFLAPVTAYPTTTLTMALYNPDP